jgi:hypothetical protein
VVDWGQCRVQSKRKLSADRALLKPKNVTLVRTSLSAHIFLTVKTIMNALTTGDEHVDARKI